MIYQSVVIITPRLCAILSVNIFYTLLVLSTAQKQTFVLAISFHGILFWRLHFTARTVRYLPSHLSLNSAIPSVPQSFAERRRSREATSEAEVRGSSRYWGAWRCISWRQRCRPRWLCLVRPGPANRAHPYRSVDRPRSNFCESLTTRTQSILIEHSLQLIANRLRHCCNSHATRDLTRASMSFAAEYITTDLRTRLCDCLAHICP